MNFRILCAQYQMQTLPDIQKNKGRKNLSRFTYENTSFQGWRLAVCRQGRSFVKYFSDRQYGSSDAAYAAAEKNLDHILLLINESKKRYGKITREVFDTIESYIQ